MAENKNQISTQEWSERMRRGSGSASSPSPTSRAPANVFGPLAQLKSNLDSLAKQRYGLAMGNVTRQYNLAERMNQATAELGANTVARRDKLYANRQDNLNRMSQLYGQYYQQFGGVLNESALRFLDKHSTISVPTLTAIMAGYEHARASRAEQELAMLDRKSKMLDAQWAVQDKIVETQQMADANKHAAAMQTLEAQSKAAQATYDAQKAFLDEQARNEMLGMGLASGGRGTGVRALPGIGGAGGGARAGVGRIPSAVTGARSGQTVAGGATPTGRVVQTAEGQTVAVDNNKNVIGTVVPTQNGSVVVNDNGQTVGSVDANGNVMPIAADPQMGAYAQYRAAGGGGFWSNPGQNTLAYAGGIAGAAGAGAILGELGESARLGYVSPDVRARYENFSDLNRVARNAASELRTSRELSRISAQRDPLFRSFTGPNAYDNYINALRQTNQLNPRALTWNQLDTLKYYDDAQRARQNALGARIARDLYAQSEGGMDALRAARRTVTTADDAGRIARTAGGISRWAGKYSGGDLLRRGLRTVAPRIGARAGLAASGIGAPLAAGLTALDVANYGPYLAGGAVGTAIQGASNFWDYASGNYDRRVADAIATGQPIPQRRSAFDAGAEMAADTKRGFWNWIVPGRTLENFGMVNRDDVNNFSRFFKNITGVDPDYETKRIFDKLPDVSRATILNGMLTNRDLTPENVQAFIDDAINTTSTPQEQQAIQQQIQAENDQITFDKSISRTTGDNKLVEAVTNKLRDHLGKLGYNFDYEDVAMFADAFPDIVSWIETRNKAGAGNKTTSATSMYQMTKDFFDYQKKYILNNFHDTLPSEQKDRLIKATKASDLDNDLDRPILRAMVLANVYNNLAVNNQHFDKQGPNIRSDQMAGDVISMMKDTYEAGQFDENGLFFNPALAGNLARIWAVSFFRGTDPKAVRDAYNNVNNSLNEAWGFRRDAQGNNLPWWDGGWNTPQRYQEMLGMPTVQTQEQTPQYKFTYDEGVDIAGVNRLLLQRVASANEEFLEGTGQPLHFTSGRRTPEKQQQLWNNRATNPNGVVGQPGYSPHNAGMAVDFSYNRALPLFNASETLKKKYGTMDKFFAAHGLDQGVIKNGKRIDLVHLAMTKDQEYFDTIDHDRYAKARGSWGKEDGNHWMRGVGERPQQVQPAWDVSPQFMVENFGYPIVEYPAMDYDPIVEYPATDYDPNLIFAGNQNGYVFDYDYDEDGNQIPY